MEILMKGSGVLVSVFIFVVLIGAFLTFFIPPKIEVIDVSGSAVSLDTIVPSLQENSAANVALEVNPVVATSSSLPENKPVEKLDIEVSKNNNPADSPEEGLQLQNPPEVIKAVYATGWSAGSATRLNYLKNLIKNTEANAIVIDLKDYAGTISYRTGDPRISIYGGEESRIRDIRKLVKELHAENIYVIGRITVFQDPIFASKRPDIAVKDIGGGLWSDNKKLLWVDPSAKDAWDYNINLARNAFSAGFDEINFDYIRFPSDGNLSKIVYPVSDLSVKTRSEVIRSFYKYLREALPDKTISADLFGLVTINRDDLGIGQVLEDAFPYFDYIAPMVYPSHYASGFLGYASPAEHPYEVVSYSMHSAKARLDAVKAKNPDLKTELRPWIQDFNLGAIYGVKEVSGQIRAAREAGSIGWMLWSPQNVYTKEAIVGETSVPLPQVSGNDE